MYFQYIIVLIHLYKNSVILPKYIRNFRTHTYIILMLTQIFNTKVTVKIIYHSWLGNTAAPRYTSEAPVNLSSVCLSILVSATYLPPDTHLGLGELSWVQCSAHLARSKQHVHYRTASSPACLVTTETSVILGYIQQWLNTLKFNTFGSRPISFCNSCEIVTSFLKEIVR